VSQNFKAYLIECRRAELSLIVSADTHQERARRDPPKTEFAVPAFEYRTTVSADRFLYINFHGSCRGLSMRMFPNIAQISAQRDIYPASVNAIPISR
jgi:hypothetical protein